MGHLEVLAGLLLSVDSLKKTSLRFKLYIVRSMAIFWSQLFAWLFVWMEAVSSIVEYFVSSLVFSSRCELSDNKMLRPS